MEKIASEERLAMRRFQLVELKLKNQAVELELRRLEERPDLK